MFGMCEDCIFQVRAGNKEREGPKCKQARMLTFFSGIFLWCLREFTWELVPGRTVLQLDLLGTRSLRIDANSGRPRTGGPESAGIEPKL